MLETRFKIIRRDISDLLCNYKIVCIFHSNIDYFNIPEERQSPNRILTKIQGYYRYFRTCLLERSYTTET